MYAIFRLWNKDPRYHRHGTIYAAVVVADDHPMQARAVLDEYIQKHSSGHAGEVRSQEWGCDRIGVADAHITPCVILVEYETDTGLEFSYHWRDSVVCKITNPNLTIGVNVQSILTVDDAFFQRVIPVGYDPMTRKLTWIMGVTAAASIMNAKPEVLSAFKPLPVTEGDVQRIGVIGDASVYKAANWPATYITLFVSDLEERVLQTFHFDMGQSVLL